MFRFHRDAVNYVNSKRRRKKKTENETSVSWLKTSYLHFFILTYIKLLVRASKNSIYYVAGTYVHEMKRRYDRLLGRVQRLSNSLSILLN